MLLASAQVQAQTSPQTAAAEVLFRQGQELFDAGKFLEACPKFAASYRLDEGLGTLLNLARCHEASRQTALAWTSYVDLAALATRAGQHDRADIANARIAVLEPKLMRMVVHVADVAQAEMIRIDGTPLAPSLYDTAVPHDPGQHLVEASADGRQTWSTIVTLDTEGSTATIHVPALLEDTSMPSQSTPPPTLREAPLPSIDSPPQPLPQTPADNPSGALPGWLIAGSVTAGGGLVLLAVSGGFAVDANSAWRDAGCHDGLCPNAESQTLSESANASAATATGLVVTGAVVAAVGVAMFIVGAVEPSTDSAWLNDGGWRFRF